MSAKRRSYETGHRPKFLVVIDDTPECGRAVRFAARRSSRTGASLVMLGIVDPPDNFEWLGVGEAMLAEAEETALSQIESAAVTARAAAQGLEPEKVVRTGEKSEEIVKLIEADEDISFLVLASASGKEGPGPLVGGIAKGTGAFAIPVVIVPGDLTDDELDALAG